MESNFTPKYEWLDTVDNGWPESEYLCVLGNLVLFVIGRWTHLDTLNSICHLSDHVWSWLRSVWRISWSVLEEILRYIILSSAKRRIEDMILSFMSFTMYVILIKVGEHVNKMMAVAAHLFQNF